MNQIHKVKKPFKLHCSAGCVYVDQKGWFREIKVWYYPKGIPNILLPKTLKEFHHVTYNSQDRDGVFKVHTKSGIIEFIPHKSGLYYLDQKDNEDVGIALFTTGRK